ncbi:ATP-dependent DNA helicase [Trichonephila clavipes]|nr:ATP-dependent DNA helicase [Trichonephila clavipes]
MAKDRVTSGNYKVVIHPDRVPRGEYERRFNAPTTNEIAAVVVSSERTASRDIVIQAHDGRLTRVPDTHGFYDALEYPIIFWKGQEGYSFDIPQINPFTKQPIPNKKVSCKDFPAYHMMVRRNNFNLLLRCRLLCHQFLVDMYVKVESQNSTDRHDLTARVFKVKVQKLVALLTKGKIFGDMKCFMYSIEWQKRGLPHMHLLLWLMEKLRPNQIDEIISAEIPNLETDRKLYDTATKNMIHGPCGALSPSSPCMKKGKCTKKYPRGLLKDTKTNDKGYLLYRRRAPEDDGHTLAQKTRGGIQEILVDNSWIVPYSPLLSKIFNCHRNVELFNTFKEWKRRVQGTHVNGWPGVKAGDALGRIYTVHVSNFECYCLRMLLNVIQGPTNFLDLKTVDGQEFETFRQVCEKLGLLKDDNHWDATMDEAVLCRSPS